MKKIFYIVAVAGLMLNSCAKNEKPQPQQEESKYSFSIGAEKETDEDGSPETRIEMINGVKHWSVGDQVGMFVRTTNGYINNIALMGQHTEPATATSFVGELSHSDISQFDPSSECRFLTYYPHNASATATFDVSTGWYLNFSTPQNITVKKGEFSTDNVFMYSAYRAYPTTWLDGNGEQQWSARQSLKYRHAYSYLRVKLDINLMGLPVTRIQVTHPESGISGNMRLYLPAYPNSQNDQNILGGNRNMIVDIDGGMNLGDEVYIPMIRESYPAGTKFTFTYSNGATYEKTIQSDITLQRGKIHNIAFKLPFIADFINGQNYTPALPNDDLANPFDFAGHAYLSQRLQGGNRGVEFWNTSYAQYEYAFATPALNLSGKTSVPVEVKAFMSFYSTSMNETSPQPNSGDRFYVNTVSRTTTSYSYSTNGTPVTITGTYRVGYVTPFTLNNTSSRIGITFKPRTARDFLSGRDKYYYIAMSRLEVVPL